MSLEASSALLQSGPSLHADAAQAGAGLESAVPLAQMPSPLLWALVIVIFGVLLIVCVLLLLRRQPGDLPPWELASLAGAPTGRYLQRLHRLIRAIRAMNSVIMTERDSRRLLERACLTLTQTRGYRMAWIGLKEEGSTRVLPVARAGFENGYLAQIEVTWDDKPTGQGPTGRAIKSGEPSVMRDIETAPEFRPWRERALAEGYRSSAALPLRGHGRVLGALNVYSEVPDAFDIEEIGLLQEVADHLAYALTSIELQEQLARAMGDVRAADWARAAFQNAPCGIITTDADGLITSVSPSMLRLLGGSQTAEDVVDRRKLRDLAPLKSTEARDNVQKLLSLAKQVEFTCEAPKAGGPPRRLCWRGVPVPGEGNGLKATVWFVEEAERLLDPQRTGGGS